MKKIHRQGCGAAFYDNTEKRDCRYDESRTKAPAVGRQLTSVRRTSNLNSLTGLPERLDFLRQVQQLLTEKKLNGWCVLSIDIEHFKLFNNWYGQVQGDELLHTIGHQLAQLAKENDYIAGYFGGDDFFLCMPDDDKRAQAVYDLIFHCIEDYQQLDSFLPLLGICPVDEHSDDISVLCNNAQIASGAVRGKLNHRICRFSEQIMQQLEKHQRLLSDVRIGIQRGEFTFYLQPKCNSLTGNIVSMEALVRWHHPEMGLVSPSRFIPLLEETGLVTDLDRYIWESVCRTMSGWIRGGKHIVPISVNVSITDMKAMDVPAHFREMVRRYDLKSELIRVEITETAFAENSNLVREAIDRLHQYGFTVLMDDFGSGYSSLNMLKDTNVDVLKLDMKFIEMNVENRQKGIQIVDSVVNMAHKLNMTIIAEGVETKEQVDMLKTMNCIYGQGYYFYRPLPVKDAERLLSIIVPEDYRDIQRFSGVSPIPAAPSQQWNTTPEIERDVIATLDSAYLLLARLNLSTGECQPLKRTPPLPDAQMPFSRFSNDLVRQRLIHPEDLDDYQRFMALAHLQTEIFSGRRHMDFRFRLSDGKRFNWVELSVLTSRGYTQQEPWTLLCIRRTDDMVNMEADRRYQRELEYYCNCDALTGLFNRMKFEKDVSLLNEEHPDTIECVYIDVVGLHEINNHLGHQTGDSMLCMVAGTARSFFPNDRLYRIGGDEFVILCCNRKHDEVLLAVEKLRMTLRGAEYEISVGVQQGTGQENVQNIVNRAEDAMRRDKEAYYQQNGQERRMRSLNEKLDRLMQEKQDADQFIRVIAPEYIAVYLINFAQDSFRKILIPDFFRDMLDKCNGSFRRAILEYIRLYIAPEDQEEFESLTCAQVVRERLAKEGTIDEHYKRSDGMPIHLRIMACDGLNKEESIWIFAKDAEKT